MKLYLVDQNPDVATALARAFVSFRNVTVECADLLERATHCVVSPANSSGFMDGGMDGRYLQFFGLEIQRRIQAVISQRPEGTLAVGTATLIRTGNVRIPYLAAVPTMVAPEAIDPIDVERAMRALLRMRKLYPKEMAVVYCPGLGTGVGGISPDEAADRMAAAYKDATL